jgi:hypothetical protein
LLSSCVRPHAALRVRAQSRAQVIPPSSCAMRGPSRDEQPTSDRQTLSPRRGARAAQGAHLGYVRKSGHLAHVEVQLLVIRGGAHIDTSRQVRHTMTAALAALSSPPTCVRRVRGVLHQHDYLPSSRGWLLSVGRWHVCVPGLRAGDGAAPVEGGGVPPAAPQQFDVGRARAWRGAGTRGARTRTDAEHALRGRGGGGRCAGHERRERRYRRRAQQPG